MPFQIWCQTKGCGTVEPYIDTNTDIVYCPNCDQEITNITYFAKNQLKSLRQFKVKEKVPYSVKCANCKKDLLPKLVNDILTCPSCNTPHKHLSGPFVLLVKEKLKNSNDE